MPGIIQIGGGFGLNIEPGGIMGVGFEVNPVAGFFGMNSSSQSGTTDLYFFQTDTTQTGTNWEANGNTRLQRVADSTSFCAYIRYSQTRRKYEWITQTASSAPSSSVNIAGQGWGFNNATTAYYSADQSMSKFTYATEAEVTSIATTTSEHNQGTGKASGNIGVVGGGGSPVRKFVQQFNMTTETLIAENAPSSNLVYSDAGQNGMACAASNAGQVFFWGGSIGSSSTQEESSKHTISTNTSAAATALSTGRRYAGGASNGFTGLVAGGTVDPGVASTDVVKVDFASDTHSAGTALTIARDPGYGTSNSHPGL